MNVEPYCRCPGCGECSAHREMREKPTARDPHIWLWTHCRALGMTKQSTSGTLEHDVALFVAELKHERDAAYAELIKLHPPAIFDRDLWTAVHTWSKS
jgi:hypothetical protein